MARKTKKHESGQLDNRSSPEEACRIALSRGETFWELCLRKYNQPCIEAVFEANGMVPDVLIVNGRPELRDPVALAGRTYLFPAGRDLEALTRSYRERVDTLRNANPDRVGPPHESTEVRLIYGDTFWKLALMKYGKEVPSEALFEANELTPSVDKDSDRLLEPIYYAGKTYRLPAEEDLESLASAYRNKHQV